MITYIKEEDLNTLARRVWFARWPKASKNVFSEKTASFEAMGYKTLSTEFPRGMRSGEWVSTGDLEISYSHGKWDIPGYIKVRKKQSIKEQHVSRNQSHEASLTIKNREARA